MSTPISFVDRTGPMQAMYAGPSAQDVENVRVWLRSIFGENSVAVPNQMNQWNIAVRTSDFEFYSNAGGSYICWDGSALYTVPKDIFEFLKVPST